MFLSLTDLLQDGVVLSLAHESIGNLVPHGESHHAHKGAHQPNHALRKTIGRRRRRRSSSGRGGHLGEVRVGRVSETDLFQRDPEAQAILLVAVERGAG